MNIDVSGINVRAMNTVQGDRLSWQLIASLYVP
jgi:hypothetical protein